MTMKGSSLEKRFETVHKKLKLANTALIQKVTVPIIYTNQGLIPQSSTVDYTGLIAGGTFISFDAKECKSKTSFPLGNIHQHQLLFLQIVKSLGGLAFFAIWFTSLDKDLVYFTPISLIEKYINEAKRKSIPIDDFKPIWKFNVDENYINNIIKIKHEFY